MDRVAESVYSGTSIEYIPANSHGDQFSNGNVKGNYRIKNSTDAIITANTPVNIRNFQDLIITNGVIAPFIP